MRGLEAKSATRRNDRGPESSLKGFENTFRSGCGLMDSHPICFIRNGDYFLRFNSPDLPILGGRGDKKL